MKLAFIGTGKIIADALYAVQPLDEIEKNAVFARAHSRGRAETLAKMHGIREVYTDYEKLLQEADIDTVYIGLINSVHYEYAKAALLAGKNVIVEEPFTGTYAEAKELAEIAKAGGLCLFEAITILHNDVFREMKKNLDRLGTIRMALCNYSQYSSRYDDYLKGEAAHAFTKEYYGGALYDINVYNVHYCVGLFGMPEETAYYPNIGPNGIDTSGTLVLKYDGFSGICTGAKDSDSDCFVSIQGEKGDMKIDGKPNAAHTLRTRYADPENRETRRDASGAEVRAMIEENYASPEKHHRMTEEFADFARIIDDRDYETANRYLDHSVSVMKILERHAVWNAKK